MGEHVGNLRSSLEAESGVGMDCLGHVGVIGGAGKEDTTGAATVASATGAMAGMPAATCDPTPEPVVHASGEEGYPVGVAYLEDRLAQAGLDEVSGAQSHHGGVGMGEVDKADGTQHALGRWLATHEHRTVFEEIPQPREQVEGGRIWTGP